MNLESQPPIQFTPWWWEWAPVCERRISSLPARVDCAIIGSGYTGLHAAITLARNGRTVLVLDAKALGEGASTRNGGQIGSGNQHFSVAELERRYRPAQAQSLLAEGFAALDYITDFIRQENIHCHFEAVGRFRGAVSSKHYERLARDLLALHQKTGLEYFMVPRQEQHTEIGTDYYHGGAVLPNDAGVHPSLYHAGLIGIAETAGATLGSHCHVSAVTREKHEFTLHTAHGRISAQQVIVATNGYTRAEFAHLHRRIVPIGSAIIATEALPAELASALIPKARMIGDSRQIVYYYRLCPEHRRMLFGGRLIGRVGSRSATDFEHLRQEMVRIFPPLSNTPLTHCWSGYVAYTRDVLPHIGTYDGIHYALGYCGSGISRSSYAGWKIARQLLQCKNSASAWNTLPFRPIPLHRFHAVFVRIATAWKRWQDQRDQRH